MTREEIDSVLDTFGLRHKWDAEGCELPGGWFLRTGSKQRSQSNEWFLWNTDGRRTNTLRTTTSLRLKLIQIMQMSIRDKVVEGATFSSRTGAQYVVLSVDDRGYTVVRPDTGSTVKVTWASVERVLRRLQGGEVVRYQATVKDGGISYTVAVAVATMYPLRDLVIEREKGWALAS